MKKIINYCMGVLMSALCMAFAGCNENNPWLGQEIPGVEILQATGTVIGSYNNGFASLLVQVDEKYQIGKTIEPVEYQRIYTSLPEEGTYLNMIQVQYMLNIKMGKKISFSYREYQAKNDFEPLFTTGGGIRAAFGEFEPDVPVYVITKYRILKN